MDVKIPFVSEEALESADNGLIGEIKDAIKNALIAEGSNIDIKDSDCPEGFNGNNPGQHRKPTRHKRYTN